MEPTCARDASSASTAHGHERRATPAAALRRRGGRRSLGWAVFVICLTASLDLASAQRRQKPKRENHGQKLARQARKEHDKRARRVDVRSRPSAGARPARRRRDVQKNWEKDKENERNMKVKRDRAKEEKVATKKAEKGARELAAPEGATARPRRGTQREIAVGADAPDMFDAALCARFAVLHDATTPHAWAHTAEVMASAFGDDWARRGAGAGDDRLGCIAQVYRGFCDGRKVAVKVCHPQIQEKVSADMRILAYFARWLGGKELVGAFGALMRDQMDLRIEARNLERFTANFGKERDVDVVFPVPVLVRPDVLVETYVEGRPINTFTTDATDAATKRRIADAGCQLVLKMVFTHNFIHADLHPGNVLVDVDDERVRVGLLDAGLAYEVTNHKSFLNVVYHLMMREGSQAGAGVAMLDGVSDGAVETARRDAYGAGVQRIVDAAKTEAFFDHLGSYIHDFFTLAYEHRVRLDHNYVCVALAVKVMEGLAIALDPQIDLLHAAMTYVAVAGRREAAKDLQSQISESLTWASRGSMTEQEKELEAAGHKVKKDA
ncbi:kinase [Aureococcus anophagefferens]|nr:kinase [Aureococcus anophagefferens]